MLERELAFHCSPAFAGIKPSNLLSYQTKNITDTKKEIERLNSQLNGSDIYIKILCEYKNRLLILVYRKKKLNEYLGRAEVKDFLHRCGYSGTTTDESLEQLAKRIKTCREFPHEVGAFLGYPINDIYGFIYHKSCCKYTGHWKVYENVDAAKRLFKKYDSCRNAVINRLNMGKTLTDMFALSRF